MTTYPDPFRLRFLKGLTAVLEGITPANGYVNNLTGAVLRGRHMFGTKDPLPMVTIIEPPLMTEHARAPFASEARNLLWTLTIQGFVADDPVNPTDPAHVLIADVKRALAVEMGKYRTQTSGLVFGIQSNRVTKVEMDLGLVRPSDDTSSKAYFWLPFHVTLIEDPLNPYQD